MYLQRCDRACEGNHCKKEAGRSLQGISLPRPLQKSILNRSIRRSLATNRSRRWRETARQWIHLAEGQAVNTLLKSDGQIHRVRMWQRQRAASTGTGVLVHDGNLMQRPIFIPPTCQLCQNSALGRQELDPRLVRAK
jgi:hypothetical protein